jgi:hypothetical protein
MAARLWTALLMLAAVFAMHGLQCTSAAGGDHGSGMVHTSFAALTAPADSPLTADPTVAAARAGTGPTVGAGPAAAHHADAGLDAAHGSTPHRSAGHLWTLCLAVLAAGIAVLLALLGPQLVGLTAPALRRARARTSGWPTALRPPDLFSLCILRT